MKKIYQKITIFDTSKFPNKDFKPKSGYYNLDTAINAMYENLWSMFNVPKDHKEKELSVSNFVWTKEIKESFYNWEWHKKIVKKMKKNRMTWGMWVLQAEPSNI